VHQEQAQTAPTEDEALAERRRLLSRRLRARKVRMMQARLVLARSLTQR
jgi:hypothetical protein